MCSKCPSPQRIVTINKIYASAEYRERAARLGAILHAWGVADDIVDYAGRDRQTWWRDYLRGERHKIRLPADDPRVMRAASLLSDYHQAKAEFYEWFELTALAIESGEVNDHA